jgi:tetratricopeptide (TPR) repeat protein
VGIKKIHHQFLIVGLCFVLGANALAQTNSSADGINPATQNALLQIQEQLHDAQLAIADTRAQDHAEAATNIAILTARIQSLEQTVTDQRAAELETARKTQQMTLILAAVFALLGLGAFMLVFYFQWRAFAQFAEISARQLALPAGNSTLAGELAAGLSGPARATVETSNMRLLTLVEQLEKRVVEMEYAARGQLSAPVTTVTKTNGHHDEPPNSVANLLADGQTLLNAEQPENALKLFEQALSMDEHNTDILIKKAGALERLNRVDDAIACYNRAIELDNSATMAWLQKGGLYNRLARYDEAMQCYEKALNAQGAPTEQPVN